MQNLYEQAKTCFLLPDPDEKLDFSLQLVSDYQANKLEWQIGDRVEILNTPGRLDKPELVAPKQLASRGFKKTKDRAALIHALAHIELTAVNLAWDTIYRYRDMPKEYYDDWVQCAGEESTHFFALRERLRAMGYDYGDFPAHDELWQMAVTTADDMMDRMGIVHRVFEARALDVVPRTIDKFNQLDDKKTVDVLTMIANDEVGHVSSGSRWFRYRCEQQSLDPDTTFLKLVQQYLGTLRGPFNHEARKQAGFSDYELQMLDQGYPVKRD